MSPSPPIPNNWLIGANSPVNLYVFPLYINTIPSVGTNFSNPPKSSILFNSNFNFSSDAKSLDFCMTLIFAAILLLISLTALSGTTDK